MTSNRIARFVVPAALVGGALVWREQERQGRPWTFLLPELLGGWALIAAGLLVTSRRSRNRCGWLLIAAGFAWFVGDFEHARHADVALAAFAFGGWQGWFLAWTVLAYPTGRLTRRRDRVLVVALAGLFATRSLSRLFLHVPPDVAGYGTENRFLPVTDDRWWRFTEDAFAWSYSAAVVLVLILTGSRWVGSSGPARRMMTPALFATTVLAASITYEYMFGWNAEIPRTTEVRILYAVRWAHVAFAAAIAIGLARLRHTRAAVVDLVAELGDDVPSPRLGDALARALGDESVQLVSWSASSHGFVDNEGRIVELPIDRPGRAITRIERHGEPVAALIHDAALLEDPGLVNAVAAAVRLTIDNEQLRAELETQLAEVEASRARIVAAGDEQRRRIERDIHDGAQQRLVTVALAMRLAEARLAENADPAVREVLMQGVKDLGEAIEELRDLARGVHPAILSESGLAAALESLVDRSPFPVHLDVQIPTEPQGAIAATAYFAVCEALVNVAKHANADDVSVRAVVDDAQLCVTIVDDGVGGADPASGSGLRGIADRVATVGGTLHVDSRAGRGTRLEIAVPCASS